MKENWPNKTKFSDHNFRELDSQFFNSSLFFMIKDI